MICQSRNVTLRQLDTAVVQVTSNLPLPRSQSGLRLQPGRSLKQAAVFGISINPIHFLSDSIDAVWEFIERLLRVRLMRLTGIVIKVTTLAVQEELGLRSRTCGPSLMCSKPRKRKPSFCLLTDSRPGGSCDSNGELDASSVKERPLAEQLAQCGLVLQ